MSRPKRGTDDHDETDLLYDEQVDLDHFLDKMGDRSTRPTRAAWRQLEERNDIRRLREQLADWDDWELSDSH